VGAAGLGAGVDVVAGGATGEVCRVPGGAFGLLVCGCEPGGKAGFCSWPGGFVASGRTGLVRGVGAGT
jgi:hypothetical protein